MQIIHRLVGYDRQTDWMRLRFDIPDQLRVATDDPDAAWSYPLTEAKTRRIARLFRDVRPFRIYDGPSEVHRWSIARRVLRAGGTS